MDAVSFGVFINRGVREMERVQHELRRLNLGDDRQTDINGFVAKELSGVSRDFVSPPRAPF